LLEFSGIVESLLSDLFSNILSLTEIDILLNAKAKEKGREKRERERERERDI